MSEGRRRKKKRVRYGKEGEAGEGQQECGWEVEEVFLWQGDQRRGKGCHESCKEEGAELPAHLPLMMKMRRMRR